MTTITRTTHWSNGMVTDREITSAESGIIGLIQKEIRRINNGPGIEKIILCYPESMMICVINKKGK